MSDDASLADLDPSWAADLADCTTPSAPFLSRREQSLWDYRDARLAAEARIDDASLGYATERADFLARSPQLTYRDWLRSSRH